MSASSPAKPTIEFGTVWWVKEKVWKKVITFYDQMSRRDGHPGLCSWKGEAAPPPYQRIPMLIGVSEKKGAQRAIGFELRDPERLAGYRTWFTGRTGPIPAGLFGAENFVGRHPGCDHLEGEDLERFRTWCRERRI